MDMQAVSLSWSNHNVSLISGFQEIFSNDTLTDVTIICEGYKVNAHKTILAVSSTVFQDIFMDNPSKHPIIIMMNTKFHILWSIIEFIYQGEVVVLRENLTLLLETAKTLHINSLISLIQEIGVNSDKVEGSISYSLATHQNVTTEAFTNNSTENQRRPNAPTISSMVQCCLPKEQENNTPIHKHIMEEHSLEKLGHPNVDFGHLSIESSHPIVTSDDKDNSSVQANTSTLHESNDDPIFIQQCSSQQKSCIPHQRIKATDKNYGIENVLADDSAGRDDHQDLEAGNETNSWNTVNNSENSHDDNVLPNSSKQVTEEISNNQVKYTEIPTIVHGKQNKSIAHNETETDLWNRSEMLYSCSICFKEFDIKSNLKNHLMQHIDKKSFKCDLCRKSFPWEENVLIHLKLLGGKHNVFSCQPCQKRFINTRSLRMSVKRYMCKMSQSCTAHVKKSFKKKTHLHKKKSKKTHVQTKLQVKKRHPRNTCKKKLACSSFNTYSETHAGEEIYSCDVCKEQFHSKRLISFHYKSHTEERPFSCEVCKKCFTGSTHLKRHSRRVHTEDKPYLCDVCKKCFKDKYKLVVHLRVHTGEKPYSCSMCKKQFHDKSIFNRHSRVHKGEKSHVCVACNKRFKYKYSLVVHSRVHTGETPYTCNICKKQFNNKSALNRHSKEHIGKSVLAEGRIEQNH